MFSVTTSAANQIREAAARSGAADLVLRVAAKRSADGAVHYGMGFDEPREGDMPLQVRGVNVVIAPPSQPMLDAVVLDFAELEPGRFGFVFAPESEVDEKPAKACGSGGCSGCSK